MYYYKWIRVTCFTQETYINNIIRIHLRTNVSVYVHSIYNILPQFYIHSIYPNYHL